MIMEMYGNSECFFREVDESTTRILRLFKPNQLKSLTPEQLVCLTPDQLKGLTPDQLKGLTPEQLGDIPPHVIMKAIELKSRNTH